MSDGLRFGLPIAVAVVLLELTLLTWTNWPTDLPAVRWGSRLRAALRRVLAKSRSAGTLASIIVMCAILAPVVRSGHMLASLVFAAVVGVATWLVVGLTLWLNTPTDLVRAPNPRVVLRDARLAAIVRSIPFAVGAAIVVGLAAQFGAGLGLWSSIGGLRVIWIAAGLGALAGLTVATFTRWGAATPARLWLAARGRLPWRLMRFLEDAHRRGVLRQVGASFQFRHARLQDHLAGTVSDSAEVPTSRTG